MFNRENANKIAKKIFGSNSDNIFAVSYKPEEAALLADAFRDGKNYYGISQITIGDKEQLMTLQEEIDTAKKDCIAHSSFLAFHPAMRERFIKQFTETTEVFKDPQTGKFYSKLDILFAYEYELPQVSQALDVLLKNSPSEDNTKYVPSLAKYIVNGEIVRWSHFFNTQGAIDFCKTIMDSMEIEHYEKKMTQNLSELEDTIKFSIATVETPVVMDLFGTDDVSFSKTFSDEHQAFKFLEQIEVAGHDIVVKEMINN